MKKPSRTSSALLLCTALAFAANALAQPAPQPIAKLKQLEGNVLVSRDSSLAAGSEGQPVLPGSRVITTANSRVVVEFDNGCRVSLQPNQRLDVEDKRSCDALVAHSALGAPQAAVGPGLLGLVVPGGAVAGGAAALAGEGRQPVSPN